jgi:ribosomal protein S18 acetylase RimI-like enzyme
MSDSLVKLYDLPDPLPYIKKLEEKQVAVRRARAYEKFAIVDWVHKNFGSAWAGECDVAFSNQPISCFIAVKKGSVLGFACYDSTYKDFFGPMGIAEKFRRQGIGRVLLLQCLHALAAKGYAYAIIGAGSLADHFYRDVVDTIEIKGSYPGVYGDRLKNS